MTQTVEKTREALQRPDHIYEAYLFDLDGTIYLGDEILPGARRLVEALHQLGKQVRFLTNNPRLDPDQYANKLRRLGVEAQPEEVITSAITMAMWLQQHHPDAKVFPIGEAPLLRALAEAEIEVTDDPAEIDFVVASVDRGLNYQKLQIAFEALRLHKRAKLVRTNPGRFCEMANGHAELDTGAVVGALEATTGVSCAADTGKPFPIMLDTVQEELGLANDQCIMTGDILGTDIKMARAAGVPGALVLTGRTTLEGALQAADDRRPDFILERIDQLLPDAVWRELGMELPGA